MNRIRIIFIAITALLVIVGCRNQQNQGANSAEPIVEAPAATAEPTAEPSVEPAVSDSCPLFDLPYPRPEPDYTGKLVRDFSPFEVALAAYTEGDAAEMAELVDGKTILELQGLMESGELTSVQLVTYYLDRIQRYDVDKLNAVMELNPEALEIAQALDEERAAGTVRGDTHGIPVLLKDNIATGDQMHTTAGAAAMLDWDPSRDAFLVSQLRDAGAVILGKANLSEWANYMDSCMPNGFSANGGQTQNPYGPFDTYGSSSGSAVSVAADLTTVSVGTETQGSIIQPAIINSVVALKPTKGLISTDYVIPLLPFQDTPGPVGRSVTDVAVLLSALTGVDENDFTTAASAELAGAEFTQFLNQESLEGVRVGVPVWNEEAFQAYFDQFEITDEEQQQSLRDSVDALNGDVQSIIDTLTAAGVVVVEIPNSSVPPNPSNVNSLLEFGFQQAINQFLADLGDEAPVASLEEIIAVNNEDLANRAPYGQDYLEGSNNTAITLEEFASQQQLDNGAARNGIDIFFKNYDIDVVVSDLGQMYAPAGYPALTVPAGYAEDGTPQGTIFVGGWMSEPQLLAVGYAYEQASHARVAPDLEATMGLIAANEPAQDAAPASLTQPVEDGGLTAKLGSLTYSGILPDQPVTLAGGIGTYDDENTGQPYVQLVDQLIPTGDLDGDGADDAAAFLVDNSTGSADFVYLVVVRNTQSNPQPLEAIMIGDRTPVKSLAVEGGQVIAEFIGPGPDDVACCPTRNIRQVFQVEDGRLVLRSSEELGQVSLADLQGTDWGLLELNLDKEPLMAGSSITLSFDDSQISGSTGCSTYNGRIKAGEDGLPQSLMVSSISAVQSTCTGSASPQETTYLDRLAEVIAWRYDFGHLSLTYKLGEEKLGELIFSPHEP